MLALTLTLALRVKFKNTLIFNIRQFETTLNHTNLLQRFHQPESYRKPTTSVHASSLNCMPVHKPMNTVCTATHRKNRWIAAASWEITFKVISITQSIPSNMQEHIVVSYLKESKTSYFSDTKSRRQHDILKSKLSIKGSFWEPTME